jgi:hypothetical protein
VAEVGAEVVAGEVNGEEAQEPAERGGGEGAGEVEAGEGDPGDEGGVGVAGDARPIAGCGVVRVRVGECGGGDGGDGVLGVERAEAVQVQGLLTVNSCIKVRLDLQADKSPVVVKGPFFPSSGEPKVSNPWNNVQRKDSI